MPSVRGVGARTLTHPRPQLSEPAAKYPSLSWGPFRTFPYLLPMAVGVIFQAISLVVIVKYLSVRGKRSPNPEPAHGDGAPSPRAGAKLLLTPMPRRGKRGSKHGYAHVEARVDAEPEGGSPGEGSGDSEGEEGEGDGVGLITAPLTSTSESVVEEGGTAIEMVGVGAEEGADVESQVLVDPANLAKSPAAPASFYRDRNILVCLGAYCLLGILFVMIDELFPLFAKWPLADGGLSFNSNQIGLTITIRCRLPSPRSHHCER